MNDNGKENKTETNEIELSSEIRKEKSLCELTSLIEEGNEVENYIKHSTGNWFSIQFVHHYLCNENEDDVLSKNQGREEIVVCKRTLIEQSCGPTE